MKKNDYYTPEVKFHKLQAKAAMLAGSEGADQGADDEELGAKASVLSLSTKMKNKQPQTL